jgi:hypothetical protein
MPDVERLEDELALAKALEPLEKAREAMHADRTPKTIAAYKRASEKVVAARQAFRTKYPPAAGVDGDGNATAAPDTVKAGVTVHKPGGAA